MLLGRKLKLAALGAAAALVLLTATSASGGPLPTEMLEFVNTGGSITLATQPALALPAGDVGIIGDWDTGTGAFTGELSANPISSTVDVGGNPVPITVDIEAVGDLVGLIDPSDGLGEIDTTFNVVVNVLIDPNAPIVCTLGPISGTFLTDVGDGEPLAPIPFDPDGDYSMTLVIDEASIAALADGACSAPGIAAVVNQTLGLPGIGSMVLPLVRGSAVPPTTPTTGATTSTTAAPAAAATQPRFTG
jgi:hypothetical protein